MDDLSSNIPLEVENEIECRLGETGLDVLVGDTEADRLGGDPGGVSRGVLVWDTNSIPCEMPGLEANTMTTLRKPEVD